jgi:hypothetical protein
MRPVNGASAVVAAAYDVILMTGVGILTDP